MKGLWFGLFLCSFAFCAFAQKHDYNWKLADSVVVRFSEQGIEEIYKVPDYSTDSDFNSYSTVCYSDTTGTLLYYSTETLCDVQQSNNCYIDILRYLKSTSDFNVFTDSIRNVSPANNASYLFTNNNFDRTTLIHIGTPSGISQENIPQTNFLGFSAYISQVISNENEQVVIAKNTQLIDSIGGSIFLSMQPRSEYQVIFAYNMKTNEFFSIRRTSLGLYKELFRQKLDVSNTGFANHYVCIDLQGNRFAFFSYSGFGYMGTLNNCRDGLSDLKYIGRKNLYSTYFQSMVYEDAIWDCKFSLNGRYLYAMAQRALYQYDLETEDPSSTRKVVWRPDQNDVSFPTIRSMERGPDGKIYISTDFGGEDPPEYQGKALSIIHAPDSANCRFEFWAVPIPNPRGTFGFSLPSFPEYQTDAYQPVEARPGPAQTYCHNSDPVQLGGTPLPKEATYRWAPETGLNYPFSPNPLAAPDTTTTYTLIVEQCRESDTATVTVTVLPELAAEAGQDTILCPGGRVQLGPQNRSRNFDYIWQPETGLDRPARANPVAAPNQTTTYTLTVLRPGECDTLASDTVRLEVDELCGEGRIFLPNAFSPNGDGFNDELTVFHENLSTFHLRIYNRWGKLVFETREPDAFWQGNYAPEGVYSYVLQVATESGRRVQKRGTVTLTR